MKNRTNEMPEAVADPFPTETPAKKPRGLDPELQAMAKIDRILAELDESQVSRVLTWVLTKNIKERCHLAVDVEPTKELTNHTDPRD